MVARFGRMENYIRRHLKSFEVSNKPARRVVLDAALCGTMIGRDILDAG